MVGWTRRNREARKRRTRWWATLTEEERQLVRKHEAETDRKLTRVAVTVTIMWCVLLVVSYLTNK